jgi:hypothetical protein
MQSDSNLVLGILALQNEFVAAAELIGAMHAWLTAKGKPLG